FYATWPPPVALIFRILIRIEGRHGRQRYMCVSTRLRPIRGTTRDGQPAETKQYGARFLRRRLQAIRQRGGNDLRNRARREDQDGAVQDGQARRARCDNDGTLERGTRSLSPIRNHLQGGA